MRIHRRGNHETKQWFVGRVRREERGEERLRDRGRERKRKRKRERKRERDGVFLQGLAWQILGWSGLWREVVPWRSPGNRARGDLKRQGWEMRSVESEREKSEENWLPVRSE
jgi:hypothetical protein